MNLLMVLIFLKEASSASLIEYKFWKNYGQVIFDYSGNQNDGVNGLTTNVEAEDVIFTDRGAYFGINNLILMPPNELHTANLILNSPFTLIFWYNAEQTEGRIFLRWRLDNMILIYRNLVDDFGFVFVTEGNQPNVNLQTSPSTWLSKVWNLIVVELSGKTINFRINTNTFVTGTYVNNYVDPGTFTVFTLGTDLPSGRSLIGFLWYFAVIDTINSYNLYISASSSTNCFSGACSCAPSMILPDLNNVCVSTSFDLTKDSLGNTCAGSNPCRNSETITCSCGEMSCEYQSSTFCYCLDYSSFSSLRKPCSCVNGGIDCCYSLCSQCTSSNVCTVCNDINASFDELSMCVCNLGYFDNGLGNCIACLSECSDCSNDISCSVCKDANAEIVDGRCKCKNGYYGPYPIGSSTCSVCLLECSTCTDGISCSVCKDVNAEIVGGRCKCISGYYGPYPIGSSTCSVCLLECSTCTDGISCSICKDVNAEIDISGRCICSNGYYGPYPIGSSTCTACLVECITCTDGISCSICKDANTEIDDTGRCKCKNGYYGPYPIDISTCTACLLECSTCTDGISCSICKDFNAEIDASGRCKCKNGYFGPYPLLESSCELNPNECLVYTLEDMCLTCKAENAYPVNGICKCQSGYWQNGTLELIDACLKCNDQCISCTEANKCKECIASYSYPSTTGCECFEGYMNLSSLTNSDSCLPCEPLCKTCSSTSICLSCHSTNEFINSQGLCECVEGYYRASNNICNSCDPSCLACTSSSNCLKCRDPGYSINSKGFCIPVCSENEELYNETCVCKIGFKNLDSNCTDYFFQMNLTVSENNKLSLDFSEAPAGFKGSDFKFYVSGEIFEFKVFKKSSWRYLAIFEFEDTIFEGTEVKVLVDKQPIYSEKGAKLKEYVYVDKLFLYEIINSELKPIISECKAGSQVAVSTSIGLSLVSDPATAWALINTIQFITYIPLSNQKLTPTIYKFCNAIGEYNWLPNVMPYLFNSDISENPFKEAKRVGIKNSVFWINIGNIIIVLLFSISLIPFLLIIAVLKLGKISNKCWEVIKGFRYNVFIRFWIQSYLDIVIFAFVQIRSECKYSPSEFYFNYTSSFIIIILAVITGPLILISIFNSFEKISDAENKVFHSKFDSIFSEFKNNRGALSSQFYPIYFIRRLVYLLSQIYLNSIPRFQILINLGFSAFCIGFLIVYLPHKSILVNISNFVSEITLLVILTLIFALSFESVKEYSTFFEKAFIYSVICCMGIQAIISLFSFLGKVKIIAMKLKKIKKVQASAPYVENFEEEIK